MSLFYGELSEGTNLIKMIRRIAFIDFSALILHTCDTRERNFQLIFHSLLWLKENVWKNWVNLSLRVHAAICIKKHTIYSIRAFAVYNLTLSVFDSHSIHKEIKRVICWMKDAELVLFNFMVSSFSFCPAREIKKVWHRFNKLFFSKLGSPTPTLLILYHNIIVRHNICQRKIIIRWSMGTLRFNKKVNKFHLRQSSTTVLT